MRLSSMFAGDAQRPSLQESAGGATAQWALPPDDLIVVVERGDVAALERLLLSGADADLMARGTTPLCTAASRGEVEMLWCLVEFGARVNLADLGGVSPLHAAVRRSHLDCVDELLTLGADPNSEDVQGTTALMCAADSGSEAAVRTLLASGGNVDSIRIDGSTALMYAAKNSHASCARLLLDAGSDPLKVNIAGETAFKIAQESRRRCEALINILSAATKKAVTAGRTAEKKRKRHDKQVH